LWTGTTISTSGAAAGTTAGLLMPPTLSAGIETLL